MWYEPMNNLLNTEFEGCWFVRLLIKDRERKQILSSMFMLFDFKYVRNYGNVCVYTCTVRTKIMILFIVKFYVIYIYSCNVLCAMETSSSNLELTLNYDMWREPKIFKHWTNFLSKKNSEFNLKVELVLSWFE